ncbi:hypothetical protein ACH4SK_43930 [Streptomyces inhibens]|uniref:hypothetical protein n=1 Tax=Streptomyces inhibens TaxID=2293571 RepID=UPI0037AA9EDB
MNEPAAVAAVSVVALAAGGCGGPTVGIPGRASIDFPHVLAAMRLLSRLGFVIEALRAVLNVLAVAAPDRLTVHAVGSFG